MAHHILSGTFRADRHGAALARLSQPEPDPGPAPRWLVRGLGTAGRAHALGMWREHENWSAGELRHLRAASEVLDRIAELRAAIARTGGAVDEHGRGHPLLRHVRAEIMAFTSLMRPLQPRAESR